MWSELPEFARLLIQAVGIVVAVGVVVAYPAGSALTAAAVGGAYLGYSLGGGLGWTLAGLVVAPLVSAPVYEAVSERLMAWWVRRGLPRVPPRAAAAESRPERSP